MPMLNANSFSRHLLHECFDDNELM